MSNTCEVCGEKKSTEVVDDKYTLNPTNMCNECADNHYAAREEGMLDAVI